MNLDSLLGELARSPDLERFYDLIEPLRAYDGARKGGLIRTLQVYFASGANATEAADRLFLHRNSMLYRLARVQELTGLDLKDPRARLALQLGLLCTREAERSTDDADKYPQPAPRYGHRGGQG